MYTDNLKFGKLPAKHDVRTLHLENYFTPSVVLPTTPDSKIWYDKVSDYGMMLNDQIGDCAIAGPGHFIQTWTANAGKEIIVSDDDILKAYSDISGYDPKTGENDNGCALLDVLNYWRKTGIGGHTIGAFASVNVRNIAMIKAGINLFGGMLNGINLPKTIKGENAWSITGSFNGDGAPGSLGGHCTDSFGFNPKEDINNTWAQNIPATWEFMIVYADERWVVFSNDFINGKGLAPNGFNRDQ